MNLIFHFAYPWFALGGAVLVALAFLWRINFYQYPAYIFPFASILKSEGKALGFFRRHFLNFLRLAALICLVIATGRPQRIDTSSRVEVEGIDIMLVMDVSGSMELFDDMQDRRTRIYVAKEEAQRFIDKREFDQIGLVLFGGESVARLPLTLDKKPIKEVLIDFSLGDIDPSRTLLFTGIATGANRLRHSKAKSKIMIVLTDGEPSGPDLMPDEVMDMVKRLGIKIYTIGIGGQAGGYYIDRLFGPVPAGAPLNEKLLSDIARRTGGKYFAAKKPDDMRKIYEIIDKLEKVETPSPMYTRYFELGLYFLLAALGFLVFEIFLRSMIWKML